MTGRACSRTLGFCFWLRDLSDGQRGPAATRILLTVCCRPRSRRPWSRTAPAPGPAMTFNPVPMQIVMVPELNLLELHVGHFHGSMCGCAGQLPLFRRKANRNPVISALTRPRLQNTWPVPRRTLISGRRLRARAKSNRSTASRARRSPPGDQCCTSF